MMITTTRTCIIVPAYNEAKSIKSVIERIRSAYQVASIVVVNDASLDDTAAIAQQAGVTVLDIPINLGIGGAVQTGLKYAKRHGFDIACQVDGDGQHDPKYLPQLVDVLTRGEADIVIGSRFLKASGYHPSLSRLIGIRAFSWLIGQVTNRRIHDTTSGYRAYNRQALVFAAEHYPSDFPEPESIVTFIRNGFRLQELPVAMHRRVYGISSVHPWRGIYFVISNAIAILISGLKGRIRSI